MMKVKRKKSGEEEEDKGDEGDEEDTSSKLFLLHAWYVVVYNEDNSILI